MNLDPAPLLHFQNDFPWHNKHHTVQFTAARLYNVWNRTAAGREPPRERWRAGLNALRQIAWDAEVAGKRVRAYGGAWSLSEVTRTPDYLINTKSLDYLAIGLPRTKVLPEAAARAKRLVFAQCGIHVLELSLALEAAGLALPTSGASNGQTLAGAIATGTHGAALHVGSMQDFVRGIHLVIDRGRHVYLEPASQPIVSDDFVRTLGAEHVKSDELFFAALVSFGSFGLVHGYVLEAAPLYELSRYRVRVDHETARTWFSLDFPRIAADAELPPATPYHLEIVFDPYQREAGQRGAYVTAMYQVPPLKSQPAPPTGGFEPGDDVVNLIADLADTRQSTVPSSVSHLAATHLDAASGEQATPGRTFSNTSVRGSVLSTELAVSSSDAPRAVEAIVELAARQRFSGLLSVRFVRGSRAPLAFTKFSPVSVTLELPGAATPETLEFYRAVWSRLDDEGIPFALHWGQCGDFGRERVRRMYGDAVDAWQSARRELLSPAGRRLFSNPWLEEAGLAD